MSGPGSRSVGRGLGIENFRLAGKNLFFERIYRTNGNPRMFGLDRDRENGGDRKFRISCIGKAGSVYVPDEIITPVITLSSLYLVGVPSFLIVLCSVLARSCNMGIRGPGTNRKIIIHALPSTWMEEEPIGLADVTGNLICLDVSGSACSGVISEAI